MNLFNQLGRMTIAMNTTNILYKLQLVSDLQYSPFVQYVGRVAQSV